MLYLSIYFIIGALYALFLDLCSASEGIEMPFSAIIMVAFLWPVLLIQLLFACSETAGEAAAKNQSTNTEKSSSH